MLPIFAKDSIHTFIERCMAGPHKRLPNTHDDVQICRPINQNQVFSVIHIGSLLKIENRHFACG
jgi:hypothetical protein